MRHLSFISDFGKSLAFEVVVLSIVNLSLIKSYVLDI